MINQSVLNAYKKIDNIINFVEKGISDKEPKEKKKQKKQSKGLLTRSSDMGKTVSEPDKINEQEIDRQKIVVAYVARIREAFKEVKNGRANTKS